MILMISSLLVLMIIHTAIVLIIVKVLYVVGVRMGTVWLLILFTLSCVSCNETTIALGWTVLMALEFFPVTVMVIVIAIVNVNLNQGSLNAFILFCQMSIVSFYGSYFVDCFDFYENSNKYEKLPKFIFLSLSIWNLDFINFLGESNLSKGYYSICISRSTTPLGAISFWYLIAFYPLFLLIFFMFALCCMRKDTDVLCCLLDLFIVFWHGFGKCLKYSPL